MQVSIKWLKDYIDFKETPAQLADMLTMAGIPVENVIDPSEGLEKVVTGRIEKLTKHENSDHLQICTMNVGFAEPVIIVTGAQNVKEGQVVPVAMIGAHLPNGMKIAKGKLRGVMSYGMLCSAQELNLDLEKLPEEQKKGIFILPEDTPVGLKATDVLGLNDVILEFELTANRGDCFSVLGLVREIAVLTGNTPKWPTIAIEENGLQKSADLIKVDIKATDLCSRFSARVLKNVKIGPSPEWMQQRLAGGGIRSINNVVDVTNFVMLELGQPLHAYDYDYIDGKQLTVRCAVEGEELRTLDDSSRKAKKDMLVIADATKAVGLAGVMGGLETEVTEKTTTVVLEAASFNGASIRRTSRNCGLHSEASGRFERGIDVTNTPRALERAAQLLQDMCTITVCSGSVDVYSQPTALIRVCFSTQQINRRLGTNIPRATMLEILRKLEFSIDDSQEEIVVTVPSWRNDVTCMEDISEEIARIYGFENIASTLPFGRIMQGAQSNKQNFIDHVKAVLCSLGMNEISSFSFTHPLMFDKMNVPENSYLRKAIPIMNPLTDEYPLVRTTLLSSVFENICLNLSRKNEDLKIFEIAPVFFPKALPVTEQPEQVLKLAGALLGRRDVIGWNQNNELIDFYDAKGVIEELFAEIKIGKYTVEAGEHYVMHPGKTALFKKGRDVIASVGEVNPKVLEALGISKTVYVFEMDINILMKYAAKTFKYQSLPKYPAVSRDLAMLVNEDIEASSIEKTIVQRGGEYLIKVCLFDVYTGKQIEEGKKSLAFSLQFQSKDKTLTDEEIDTHFQTILEAIKEDFNATLRA
jgi:phenylalanyl-tRNA synthetase beta chain